MAQFAIAQKRKTAGETVRAFTSVYSSFSGNATVLKRNALGEFCQPEERKATIWKTRAGAEKKLADLIAHDKHYGEYEVVEIGLTNDDLRSNLSLNFRDVLVVLKNSGNLDLALSVK